MRLEKRLSKALEREAREVVPSGDGLRRIRARTERPPVVWLSPVAAMAGVLVLVAAVWLAVVPPSGWPPPLSAFQSGSSATAWRDVPVYYLNGSGDAMLIREVRDLTGDRGRLHAAVTAALSAPLDPDYRSGWPAGTVLRDVQRRDDVVTLTLSGEGAGSSYSELGAMQLAYTVAAGYGRAKLAVRVVVDGEGLSRAIQLAGGDSPSKFAAPVVVLAPRQGATVPSGEVTIRGEATEAMVVLSVEREGTEYWGGKAPVSRGEPGTWSTTLRLKPGRYLVRVTLVDGGGSRVDTKEFTVR